MEEKICFVSYAHVDKDFVLRTIIPILEELGFKTWIDYISTYENNNFYEVISTGLKNADFVIVVYNSRSSFVNYEVGSAIGQGKPILAIIRENETENVDIRKINYIVYGENNRQFFKEQLNEAISLLLENVIDKTSFLLSKNKKLIGIQIGSELLDLEKALRTTADLVKSISDLTNSENIELFQAGKGSLKSLISLDLKSWAELIEKIIFFIPELKKRNAERGKLIAESNEIKARTRKTIAETKKINFETEKQKIDTFFEILDKSQKQGIKLQFDNELLISLNKKILTIKEPNKLNKRNIKRNYE